MKRQSFKIVFIAILVLLTNSCKKDSDKLIFTIYNNEQLSSSVLSIATDVDGKIWAGSQGGVSKFDGIKWTNYTKSDGLAGDDVMAIAIDLQGNKWFGTNNGGVSKFNGTTWTTYNTSNGLAGNNIASIAVDTRGNIWVGTFANAITHLSSGVSKFDGIS